MKPFIALVMVLAGIGGGLAVGTALRPPVASGTSPGKAENTTAADEQEGAEAAKDEAGAGVAAGEREYVKIGRQMVVPVVEGGETRALMLFELAIDVPVAMTERAYALEPRLRDSFLRVLFEMSYTGAFLDTYTDERIVSELRGKLRAAARGQLGDAVAEVLILDIVRQEL